MERRQSSCGREGLNDRPCFEIRGSEILSNPEISFQHLVQDRSRRIMTVINDGAWVAAISESIGQPWHCADASDGCKLGFEMRVSTMRQFSWRLCCIVHGKAY